VPLPVKGLAWLGLALAGALIFWTLAANTYLSRMARIQEDRGQVVVTAGPYRFVRHPMYSGIILLFIGMPIALGSLWALLPGAVIGALFVLRTAKEDRMLRDELSGYAEYAQRVRYRLVPRVW
jgi:protein-S-isoprenylcysteine O-methyltransferase Ste14